MIEIWKPITGYEHRYDVSNMGRVRSRFIRYPSTPRSTPRFLHPRKTNPKYGHLYVSLTGIDGKSKNHLIHRLVATAFIGPCPKGLNCAHLDGDAGNNRVENLLWVTQKENLSHCLRHGTHRRGEKASYAKLKNADVIAIRKLKNTDLTYKMIGALYGVSRSLIGHIMRGESWIHIQ